MLARDERTLHLAVELALADGRPTDRVVVVVDQLEEVFTLCSDEIERRQLFSTLLDATSAPGGRTIVIVTLRTDFYARCAAYPELAQLIGTQQMLVGPMDAEGLRQAIEEPAHQVGLELEQGLSDTILADIGAEPGGLPLIEHALLELWERRRGSMLTLEGYMEAGGVHGALAQRADEIYDQLSPDQQQIARRALLRLTQPGQGTEDTRRRAPRDELVSGDGDDDSFDQVLGRLVDARLLTTGRDETGEEIVDVSHEALIRGWPRLREWIDADRAGLLTHRRLTGAAHEWGTLNREPAALYRGARLAAASEWATEHDDDLSRLERDFLTASHASENSEAEMARRRTRRLRGLVIGLAVLTVIVAALAVSAIAQRDDLQQERNVAQHQATQATARAYENSLITIESGLRGYVASGQLRLLAPVRDALRQYPAQQRELARRVSDDAGQRQFVVDIGTMIDDYVRLWAVPVIGLAAKSIARAQSALLTNYRNPNDLGRRLEPIQREFARLYERERAMIGDGQQAAEQRSARPITYGIGGLAFVLAVAFGSTLYLRRSAARSDVTVSECS
jgi:CHASE3 domain sensor protein